jgi:aminoacylase
MQAFLSSALYRSLPGIAFALDEGLASMDDTYSLFYGERLPWWVDVTATGRTGHGSRFVDSTAVEQIVGVSNRALAFRREQRDLLHGTGPSHDADHSNCAHAVAAKRQRMMFDLRKGGQMTLGDVTSLNITTLEAGIRVGDTFAYNCVPPMARCTFDIRISPHVEPREIGEMIDDWCRECSASPDEGYQVVWKSVGLGPMDCDHALTKVDDTNPWFRVFEGAMSGMGRKIVPQVFPAASDSRFLRQLGIRAFGFSPMRNTEVSIPDPLGDNSFHLPESQLFRFFALPFSLKIMLHENDEYLEEDIFIEGIEVYVNLIAALGSVTEFDNGAHVVG